MQWERLHASAEYIPKGVVLINDEQVPTHMKTKYPKWTIFEENQRYEYVLDKCDYACAYLTMIWKKGTPGAQDEKRPRDCCDVGDEMLISWLKTDWKMDIVGSRNGEGKFGKRPIYSCRAHIATSFVPAAIVTGRAVFRGDLEIWGGRRIRVVISKCQVSSLIILHRNGISFFGQGLYRGPYRDI